MLTEKTDKSRSFWLRGLQAGAGFGLAMAVADAWLQVVGILMVNIGSPVPAFVEALLLHVGLGTLIGLLVAPLLRLPAGRWLHLAGTTAIWLGLLVFSGIPTEAMQRRIALTGFVAGLFLAVVGGLLARRWPRLVAALGVLLAVAALATPVLRSRAEVSPPVVTSGQPRRPDLPDVVLVVLDTVRADHVGAYGYPRDTTPSFDAVAAEGALYLNASAPATWSLPSHASLFTGRFPSSHQAHQEHRFLDTTAPTLAETLAAAGYETRCFTANPWISSTLGLTRGFQWCDEGWRQGQLSRSRIFAFRLLDRLGLGLDDKGGGAVATGFERWVADRPEDGPPTFSFLNFIESHFPYHQVPAEYLKRFSRFTRAELREVSMELMEAQFGGEPPDPARARERAIDMYDAGLAYADHLLGRVVEALRRRGSLDRTIVVVLADHGELLGDHGAYGHGQSVLDGEARVPLAVRYPARIAAGTRVAATVSTVGVFATILDLLELDPPTGLQVQSLLPAIAGGPAGGPALTERFAGEVAAARSDSLEESFPLFRSDLRFRAYRVGDEKLIESSDGSVYLYDVGQDPGETRDLVTRRPDEMVRLRDELADWQAALGLPPLDAEIAAGKAPDLDDAARERLRALGYVD